VVWWIGWRAGSMLQSAPDTGGPTSLASIPAIAGSFIQCTGARPHTYPHIKILPLLLPIPHTLHTTHNTLTRSHAQTLSRCPCQPHRAHASVPVPRAGEENPERTSFRPTALVVRWNRQGCVRPSHTWAAGWHQCSSAVNNAPIPVADMIAVVAVVAATAATAVLAMEKAVAVERQRQC